MNRLTLAALALMGLVPMPALPAFVDEMGVGLLALTLPIGEAVVHVLKPDNVMTASAETGHGSRPDQTPLPLRNKSCSPTGPIRES